MAIYAAAVLAAIGTMIALKMENRKADQGKELIPGRPDFRYTL